MTKQEKFTPPWKVGDMITGIDRSYPRSIYRFHGMADNNTIIKVELLALAGIIYKDAGTIEQFPNRGIYTYRLATREELIEAGVLTKSVDFILNE